MSTVSPVTKAPTATPTVAPTAAPTAAPTLPPIPSSLRASSHEPMQARGRQAPSTRSAFAPLLLLGLAVLSWFVFQCWQLLNEREQLQQAHTAQDPLVQNSANFRARLDTVARETQLLADKGNPNARLLVDELRKRGITISPNAAPARAPGVDSAPTASPVK